MPQENTNEVPMEVLFFIQEIKSSDHCVDMNDPEYFLLMLETLASEFVLN